ncbi:MAG: SDR family oxidoreductase [Myxococcota bacterium]|jgi:NAD(P)-dependent dehydrogenase (short-subunit alcohol dehydrogenase family)|nr:SDR family oxidoreductase [Myxococcota bacterium]
MDLEEFNLSGKTALITGGTSGIGRASAELFHAAGAHVAITGRDPDTLSRARRELPEELLVLEADVTSASDTAKLARELEQRFGGLDVLFLNAGIARLAPFESSDEASFDAQFAINVKGPFFTLQKLLPLLRPGASVILNTSVADLKGSPGLSIYAATKGAIASLVRTLSLELAPRKIRVNSLSPGPTHTAIQTKFGLPAEAQAAVERDFSAKIPLGRFGDARETARAALFLASAASSFVTGTELPVDGGLLVA